MAKYDQQSGYVLERASLLARVNSKFDEIEPVISWDRRLLYFGTHRPHADGGTDSDIWVATRQLATEDFSSPTLVGNVSSTSHDSPSFISKNSCRLYFYSDRPGGAGGQDLYVATRPK